MTGRVGKADQALAVPATPANAVDGPLGFDPSRIRALADAVRDSQIPTASQNVLVDLEALCNLLIAAHDWAEIAERVADVDYWEGNGTDLIEWVALGYVECGAGRRVSNPRWQPLSAIATEARRAETTSGSVHEGAGRNAALPENKSVDPYALGGGK